MSKCLVEIYTSNHSTSFESGASMEYLMENFKHSLKESNINFFDFTDGDTSTIIPVTPSNIERIIFIPREEDEVEEDEKDIQV